MKELIRFDDETQRTFLKEVSGDPTCYIIKECKIYSVFSSEAESTIVLNRNLK